uniref:Uncharacterized protein n=1 Tax=Lygus hesperus TaxID=30085 RepID=A0A0A9Y0B5_LYGHE
MKLGVYLPAAVCALFTNVTQSIVHPMYAGIFRPACFSHNPKPPTPNDVGYALTLLSHHRIMQTCKFVQLLLKPMLLNILRTAFGVVGATATASGVGNANVDEQLQGRILTTLLANSSMLNSQPASYHRF